MSIDTSNSADAPAKASEPTTCSAWTQVGIDTERQRRAADLWTQRVLGPNSTPVILADIERHIRQMDGDHLAVAFEVLGQTASEDTSAIAELQNRLGHDGPARAYRFRQTVDAFRFGVLPTSPSAARYVQRRLRAFRRRFDRSLLQESVRFLQENERRLSDMLDDEGAHEAEENEAAQAEVNHAEQLKKSGVYVFTYPHYHRNPTVPSERTDRLHDRTLMKIGSADRLGKRIDQIANVTGAPEPRRILRLYLPPDGANDVRAIERKFHRLLDAAGHAGPRRASVERQAGGTEWFATSLEFLDSIAEVLELEVVELDAVEGL